MQMFRRLYSKFAIATTNVFVVVPTFAVKPGKTFVLGDDSKVNGTSDTFW
jgi:hypothetical protein